MLLNEAQSRTRHWQDQLREVEAAFLKGERTKQQLMAARAMADLASQRLATYARRGGSFYPCPQCWIDRGQRGKGALYLPTTNGFQCDTCNWSMPPTVKFPEVWRCF
jgi:hypothetical protein